MKVLQFIGTQRSGSNLLRVMLHQHPELSAPHPPHLMQVLLPFLPMYGDLSDTAAFAKLVDDACTLVELNPVSWGIHFDREEVAARCNGRNLPQLVKAIYELKAAKKNASTWCCKSMANIHYAGAIEAAGIHPFYIFIYRDGRDVALSFMKAIVGEKHIYPLAKQWQEEQELSLALCQRLGPQRSIRIRYEDFILDPETQLRELCARLGLDYFPGMMEYAGSEESRETASSGAMWGNLVRPVMKKNKQKFLHELDEEQLLIFESVAGDTLKKLGYPLQFDVSQRRSFTDETRIEFDRENRQLKKIAKEKAAPSDVEKRKAQDAFIASLQKILLEFNSSLTAHE